MGEPRGYAAEHTVRLLVEKRCELYSRAASLLMDLDEALDQDDGVRARYLLHDIRRCLRGALAFLTREVYVELERLEALSELLPHREGGREGPIPAGVHAELADRAQLLHVKLARSLQLPRLQDMEEIVGLPSRLKRKLASEARELLEGQQRREVEEQCFRYESEARELIGGKQYPKAIKSLRKAIRLDPDRAVFRNDLGVVLSLMGRSEEAVAEYRAAVTLNERDPSRRTDEWTTSYYNLGIALRKAAHDALGEGRDDDGLSQLREAEAAFLEYARLNATGAKA